MHKNLIENNDTKFKFSAISKNVCFFKRFLTAMLPHVMTFKKVILINYAVKHYSSAHHSGIIRQISCCIH